MRKSIFFILCSLAVLAGPVLTAQPAAADNCMQNIFQQAGNTQTLKCSANDVTIASVQNITPINGGGLTDLGGGTYSCIVNSDIEFTADFKVLLTAQTRYDIGLYIATNGTQARTGMCNTNVLTSTNALPFVNLDPTPDMCGDINSANNPQIVRMDIKTKCVGGAIGASTLRLPNCTSWRQPGANEICQTNADGTDVSDAYPGSPSKCHCDDNFTVSQIAVTPPSGTVSKTPEATAICAVVRYDVTVTNTNGASHLTALCDDKFGDISDGATSNTTPDKAASTACPTGTDSSTSLRATTCTLSQALGTSSPGNTYNCTFDAEVCDFPHTNTVAATLQSDSNHLVITETGGSTVNGATVTIGP